MRIFEILGFKVVSFIKNSVLKILSFTGIHTVKDTRNLLLKRLEEKKYILEFIAAAVSYIEEAYDIWGSYGMPREKIFISYNSPDTDLLFAVREKIEKEAPILPPSSHRIIHVGRLVPWKRVDMLIES